ELGADEYVTKPFALRPLLARVKALLRRAEMSVAAHPPAAADTTFADFVLDRSGRRLRQGTREIPLTMKAYDLLAFLIARRARAAHAHARQLVPQLPRTRAETVRLATARRDFLANISHEVRTPLASIKLLVDTLESGALDDPDAALTFTRRIGAETEHLIDM